MLKLRRLSVWAAVLPLAWGAGGAGPTAAAGDAKAFAADVQRGRRLTEDAAQKLEATVPLRPEDPAVRGQLIGYYVDRAATYPQRRLPHLLWLIRHRPADPATPGLVLVSPTADPAGYAAVSSAWDEQVAAHSNDSAVVANAAGYFDNGTDTAKAQELYRQRMSAEPKAAEWPARLAGSLERQADRDPTTAADLCGQALLLRQSAFKLATGRPERFHQLIDQPSDAFRAGDLIAAKRLAGRLLESATEEFPTDPRHAEAIHRGRIVLGQIALNTGNADRAGSELLAAAKVEPSAAMTTTGPDLTLARDLLAHGERAAVKEYLVACQPIWPGGRERLRSWVAQLDAGQVPTLR